MSLACSRLPARLAHERVRMVDSATRFATRTCRQPPSTYSSGTLYQPNLMYPLCHDLAQAPVAKSGTIVSIPVDILAAGMSLPAANHCAANARRGVCTDRPAPRVVRTLLPCPTERLGRKMLPARWRDSSCVASLQSCECHHARRWLSQCALTCLVGYAYAHVHYNVRECTITHIRYIDIA